MMVLLVLPGLWDLKVLLAQLALSDPLALRAIRAVLLAQLG